LRSVAEHSVSTDLRAEVSEDDAASMGAGSSWEGSAAVRAISSSGWRRV
jgi:hypothetical protein